MYMLFFTKPIFGYTRKSIEWHGINDFSNIILIQNMWTEQYYKKYKQIDTNTNKTSI